MENGKTIYSSTVTLVKKILTYHTLKRLAIGSVWAQSYSIFQDAQTPRKKINKAFGMFYDKFYHLLHILKLGTYIHVHADIIINSICVQFLWIAF